MDVHSSWSGEVSNYNKPAGLPCSRLQLAQGRLQCADLVPGREDGPAAATAAGRLREDHVAVPGSTPHAPSQKTLHFYNY